MIALRSVPSMPAEHLTQIRWRKKWLSQDMLCEILQSSTLADCEHTDWKGQMAKSRVKDRAERDQMLQERQRDRDMHQEVHEDIMALLRQRAQMLQNIIEVNAQRSCTQQPFHSMEKPLLLLFISQQNRWQHDMSLYPTPSCWGKTRRI